MKIGNSREIDVHNTEAKYRSGRESLIRSDEMLESNKNYILDFLDDCQLGKTVIGRAKKRIKPNRLTKYLSTLKQIARHLKKDFKDITQKDMEEFITKVDSNSVGYVKASGDHIPRDYTEWTRRDIKVTLKKFYKWLLGDNIEYPKIVSWIDTHIKEADPPALNFEEIRAIADHANGVRGKALIWALFETGARASEFLNIRIGNVVQKGNYHLLRIEFSKTFKRTLPIYEGNNYLTEWIEMHPMKENLEAQLFPIKYGALNKWLKRLGEKAIGKNVYAHLFRHSFATWLAGKKVGRYQMCKLMGWAMSSDMPDRYIDRQGVVEEETLQNIRGDELSKAQTVNQELKKELTDLQMKYSQIAEQIDQKRKSDNFLDKIMADKEVQQLLCKKIKALGLGDQLINT